jgi:hypothetical protein
MSAMHSFGRRAAITTSAMLASLALLIVPACSSSGGRSVTAFCSVAKDKQNDLNRPAVGVGVDNAAILKAHVAALKLLSAKAPDEIKDAVSSIYSKEKAFLDKWQAANFRTNDMPDFDEALPGKYTQLDDYASKNCAVKLTH